MTRLSLALAATALLGVSLLAAPTNARPKQDIDRAMLAQQAERVIEQRRMIDVSRISRCAPRRRDNQLDYSRWVCEWRGAGVWPGEVPYRCKGDATWSARRDIWRVAKCKNQMQPRVPLLAEPGPAPMFGYNDDWAQRSNATIDLMALTEPDTARAALPWATVESSQGTYEWTRVDRVYEKLRARGIRPLWALIEAPCWAQPIPSACRDGKNQLRPAPQHYEALARFAAAAARRYPAAVGIEVWNEPNYPRFWGAWPQPDLYAEMLARVADAIHAAAPGMTVVSAGLSPHSDSDRHAIGFGNFLTALYESGAAQKADAIGIHPYPGGGPEEDHVDAMRIQLGKVDLIMGRYGDDATPMWATELGISTSGAQAFTPADQAQALVDLYSTTRRIAGLPLVVVHRFLEQPALGEREAGFGVVSGSENGFLGLFAAELTRKPAYCALNKIRAVDC